ncbi:hypothetical protein ACNKHR_26690 [Shigella flexneri]
MLVISFLLLIQFFVRPDSIGMRHWCLLVMTVIALRLAGTWWSRSGGADTPVVVSMLTPDSRLGGGGGGLYAQQRPADRPRAGRFFRRKLV